MAARTWRWLPVSRVTTSHDASSPAALLLYQGMLTLHSSDSLAHDYLAPTVVEASGEDEMFVSSLIATKAFRRLRSIRFLGAIDYLFVPTPNGKARNIRYTRFQHSLGVAQLASLYSA